MDKRLNVFAPAKVAGETEKVQSYLNGEKIFPTTVELDLTQKCTRACPGCPYTVSRRPGLTLKLDFLDRLFSILGENTPGLVLSGGEPTSVSHFPEVVSLARKRGFKEIAVISNGGMTHLPEVQDALLEHATAIRFSLYDWQNGKSKYFLNTLKKINDLRYRIDKEGSSLEIGASILTRKELNHKYKEVGLMAIDSGIDWLYFHPYCIGWEDRYPKQADQEGVLEAIEQFKKAAPWGANIQVPEKRYSSAPLYFDKLHGSHFLIQVGADGVNYAGPECKYENDAILLDLNEYMKDDFLWHPKRIAGIERLNSNNYRFIGTKHRPPMFSNYIQGLIDENVSGTNHLKIDREEFSYPNIL